MKRFAILLVLFFAGAISLSASAPVPDLVQYEPFGNLHIYKPSTGSTNAVVLIVSGDGGWRGTVLSMAAMLSAQNTLVAGVDIRAYFRDVFQRRETCTEMVPDFLKLTDFLRERYAVSGDQKALLLGFSSGATLVYGVLAQARANDFLGGISFGFCPDLQLRRPLCGVDSVTLSPNQRLSFLPARSLANRWYAFQGMTDQVCKEPETEAYMQQVPNSKFIVFPLVGHGFRKTQTWIEQFRDAYLDLTHQNLNITAYKIRPRMHTDGHG